LAEYEKVNPEVVDTLFGFIDYNKFKKAILLHKFSLDENYDRSARTEIDAPPAVPQNEKFFMDMAAEDVNDPKSGWRKSLEQKEKDGVIALLHQRGVEGKSLNIVRNDAVIKNVSLKAYAVFCSAWDQYQIEFDTYKQQVAYKMVEQKEEDGIKKVVQYSRMKMGPMVSDRESLIYSEIRELADNKFLVISNTIDRDDIPPAADAVRMEFFKATQYEQ